MGPREQGSLPPNIWSNLVLVLYEMWGFPGLASPLGEHLDEQGPPGAGALRG